METSHFSESQGIEKSTSNSLALQVPPEHEQFSSMSNNLPHKVTKKTAMTEDTCTQVECKFELKDCTINLCQKIIVEQFYLSRDFEDTTLSPDKFTPVSEKFIQVLNVSNKHWILVFGGQFG